MQIIRNNVKEIIFFVIELVIGILLLINPIGFTTGIIIAGGVGIGSAGVLCIFKYFRQEPEEAKKGHHFSIGLLLIMIGLFCVIRSDWFIATFPILTVIYGIFMLLTGISKIQTMVDMLRLKNSKWFWAGVNAAVSIVCAVLILWSPFTSTTLLWIFAGVSLIVEAILDIVTIFLAYIGKKVVEDIIETEAVEDMPNTEPEDEILNTEDNIE